MAARSKLQKFAIDHPHADLAIVRNFQPFMPEAIGEESVDIIWQTRVIAHYSRRRDAWRALKASGYVAEGAFWRITPAVQREPHPFSIPEHAE